MGDVVAFNPIGGAVTRAGEELLAAAYLTPLNLEKTYQLGLYGPVVSGQTLRSHTNEGGRLEVLGRSRRMGKAFGYSSTGRTSTGPIIGSRVYLRQKRIQEGSLPE
jgi:hypothetical protein